MASKIKNIIIFTVIAAILILIYIFFLKPSPEEANLVSNNSFVVDQPLLDTETLNQNSEVAKDFLAVLLNVKNIQLNDTIFSKKIFLNLHDSSILLISPGDEGRVNPFAPIGYESAITSSSKSSSDSTSTSITTDSTVLEVNGSKASSSKSSSDSTSTSITTDSTVLEVNGSDIPPSERIKNKKF